jgi:YARHG domain
MKRLSNALALAAALAASLAVLAPAPAKAGCVPGIGCTNGRPIPFPRLYDASCGDLWYLRNSAFADNGYCFGTQRGRNVFGNAGCIYRDSAEVPMTRAERANVARIREVERERGCR